MSVLSGGVGCPAFEVKAEAILIPDVRVGPNAGQRIGIVERRKPAVVFVLIAVVNLAAGGCQPVIANADALETFTQIGIIGGIV
jgi:hypothetical protein